MAGQRKAPSSSAKKTLVVAKDGFVAEVDGQDVIVKQGEVLSSSDPVAKAHPELFEPAKQAAA